MKYYVLNQYSIEKCHLVGLHVLKYLYSNKYITRELEYSLIVVSINALPKVAKVCITKHLYTSKKQP